MKQTISRLIDKKHNHSKTLIFWCSDPRLRGAVLNDFIVAGGFDPYDLICIPGGAKCLVSNGDMSCNATINQIKILRNLHNFNVIVLSMHEDCGACGGSKAFGNDFQVEQRDLLTILDIAKQTILDNFPDIHVVRALVRFTGFEILD